MNTILDFQETPTPLQQASRAMRFANFLIDSIFIMLVYHTFQIATDTYVPADAITPEGVPEELWNLFLVQQLTQLAITLAYYILSEYFLEGKTAGKYLTRTKAIRLDGQKMDFGTTLLRSLVRLVPFEAFSFLGPRPTGWHDRWTKTVVIKEIGNNR
ncbi:MAG: RDD family protein [Bacteroidota bacterium]